MTTDIWNPERQVLWWHLVQKWNTQMEKPTSRFKHVQSTVTPYSIWSAAGNNRLARKLKSLQRFYLCCEKNCSKHLCWVTGLQPKSCRQGKRDSPSPPAQCQPCSGVTTAEVPCEDPVGRLLGRTTAEVQWDGAKMQLCRANCNATGDSVPNICLHSTRNPLGFGFLQEGSIAIPSNKASLKRQPYYWACNLELGLMLFFFPVC